MSDLFSSLGFSNEVTPTFVRVLAFGTNFTGKSTLGVSFPNPEVIDIEKGTQMLHKKQFVPWQNIGFGRLEATSAGEILKLFTDLNRGLKNYDGPVRTVVVDSQTKLWEIVQKEYLQNQGRINLDGQDANLFNKQKTRIDEWVDIKRPLKAAMLELTMARCHKVFIAHTSDVTVKQGKEFVKVGTTFKAEKSMDYDMDIIVEMLEWNDPRNSKGIPYVGLIHKDRTGIFQQGQLVENPRYQLWQEFIESGKEIQRSEPKNTMPNMQRPDFNQVIFDTMNDPEVVALMDQLEIEPLNPDSNVEDNMRFKISRKYKGNKVMVMQVLNQKLQAKEDAECPV
jgi:hypothetical protein